MPAAARFAAEGVVTGGGGRNVEQLGERARVEGSPPGELVDLFYDPQTSGGLLIAVPEAEAESLRAQIAEQSGGCWRVGHVEAGPPVVVARA